MNTFTSHAKWPDPHIGVTTDTHDREDQAIAVCEKLTLFGLGQDGKMFPESVWVTKGDSSEVLWSSPAMPVAPVNPPDAVIPKLPRPEFCSFSKIARFSRRAVITEKIDGTNGLIHITADKQMFVGSRNLWITPDKDNAGFARWAYEHEADLQSFGPGFHFGEWWGKGIQRNYGLTEKRFSVFNTERWCLYGTTPKRVITGDPRIEKYQQPLPTCVGLVPVLWEGNFEEVNAAISYTMNRLAMLGSVAARFDKPEGIVICHVQSGHLFKKTLEGDGQPKSLGTA